MNIFTFSDPIIFTTKDLQCSTLYAKKLNNKRMNDIVTLHTPQTFKNALNIGKFILQGPLPVGGLVNGKYLPHEQENTLMVSNFTS